MHCQIIALFIHHIILYVQLKKIVLFGLRWISKVKLTALRNPAIWQLNVRLSWMMFVSSFIFGLSLFFLLMSFLKMNICAQIWFLLRLIMMYQNVIFYHTLRVSLTLSWCIRVDAIRFLPGINKGDVSKIWHGDGVFWLLEKDSFPKPYASRRIGNLILSRGHMPVWSIRKHEETPESIVVAIGLGDSRIIFSLCRPIKNVQTILFILLKPW